MPQSVLEHARSVANHPARLLADWLRACVGLLPTWRVEYFESAGSQTQRSIVVAAHNIADALEEVGGRHLLPRRSNQTRPDMETGSA